MLIIGYNHIFIGCFQVEHVYLIVFFKRTFQPIAVEIRLTVVSCHDLWYFSGFNPVLEENIQIRKHD
jgi:predicted metallopeptidase